MDVMRPVVLSIRLFNFISPSISDWFTLVFVMTIMNHTASITTPEVAPVLDLKSYKNTVTCCCVRETERSDSRLTQRVLTVLLSFQSIPTSHFPLLPPLLLTPSLPLSYRNWPISWVCFSILPCCACIHHTDMFLCSSVRACSSSSVPTWLSANSLTCHNSLISQEQVGLWIT